jgi:hypothetical protein
MSDRHVVDSFRGGSGEAQRSQGFRSAFGDKWSKMNARIEGYEPASWRGTQGR